MYCAILIVRCWYNLHKTKSTWQFILRGKKKTKFMSTQSQQWYRKIHESNTKATLKEIITQCHEKFSAYSSTRQRLSLLGRNKVNMKEPKCSVLL